MPIEPIEPFEPNGFSHAEDDDDDEDEPTSLKQEVFITVLSRMLHAQAEGYSLAETVGHLVDFFSFGLTEEKDGYAAISAEDLIEAHEVMSALRDRSSIEALSKCRSRAMSAYQCTWNGSFKRTLAIFGGKNEDYSGAPPDVQN